MKKCTKGKILTFYLMFFLLVDTIFTNFSVLRESPYYEKREGKILRKNFALRFLQWCSLLNESGFWPRTVSNESLS